MFRLSAWAHFWRVEVPFAMPQLIWNMMVSMSGSWFFVVASEAISVGNTTVTLPGVGSYIALAIEQKNLTAVGWAIGAMLVVILLYDQVLFRPLVAWADRFRFEQQAGALPPRSWVLDVLRRSRIIAMLSAPLSDLWQRTYRPLSMSRISVARAAPSAKRTRWIDRLWTGLVVVATLLALWQVGEFILPGLTAAEVSKAALFGLATLLRVIVLITIATVIWVPIGVMVGMRPQLAQFIQPIAQFLAAFPANVLFPVFVVAIVTFRLNPDIWLSPLMILGTQWYILFNVVAGAAAIPNELRDVGTNLQCRGWLWWRKIALPAVFPYFCDRRHHRLRRLVERQHRRRSRLLGRHAFTGRRPRRLYCASDRCRRHASRGARNCGDEFVRRDHQSRFLAAAVLVRRAQVPAGMTGQIP